MNRQLLLARTRRVRRLANRVEVAQIERFGRSVVSVLYRTPVLVVVSTGRHTGQSRRTPVAYLRHGEDVIVAGGAAGQAAVPDWVANLRADPKAAIVVDRLRHQVEAEELIGPARDRWWPNVRTRWPRVAGYETLAGRPVPIFRFRTSPDL